MSPRHLFPSSAKHQNGPLSKRHLHHHHHVELSIPQICIDNTNTIQLSRLQPPPSTRDTGSPTSLGAPSPPSSASIFNSIISPPRVFIQEFARLPPPFFHESVTAVIDSELNEAKQPPKHSMPFLTSCLPPPPLPLLTMPPLKKRKMPTAPTSERKQVRCSYPECPNLSRSAGFCNRHSGKVCSINGCNKSALSRGKCPEHGGGSRCKRDGCAKFAQTRGLCKSHGGGRQCSVTGCSKNAHQNRLCRSHGGGKRCDYQGCPKWAQRSGYCCAHTKLGSSVSDMTSSSTFPSSNGAMGCTSPDNRLLNLLP